jgi:rhamnosyltransferase
MTDKEPLAGVALAISSFRSDEAVLRLLRTAFEAGKPRFGAIIVVDSLGSGAIPELAEREGWAIRYVNSETNLGSAGNLDLRLRTAAELGFEWCLALNHDGEIDPEKVLRLVEHGRSRSRVGAVYPLLRFVRAGGKPDSPRPSFSTFGVLGRKPSSAETGPCVEVAWSSSNGALYRLDAVREGVRAWPQLWMGYEDLALGWELKRAGWTQLLCSDVEVADDYEFAAVRLPGREVHLAAKPPWYSYYQSRNLLLIAAGTQGAAVSRASALFRFLTDVGLIVALRDRKIERLRLLLRGFVDGLRGRTGKGQVP